MSIFWDERYRNEAFAYGKAPNEYFSKRLGKLKPKKLLLPAEGEGRNAVYAAQAGWQVDAFDFSPVAQQHAIDWAQKNSVSINYFLANFNFLALPENTYHCIALIFTHMPPDIRPQVHRTLMKSLKPGGVLMAELFSKDQLNYDSGGPKDEGYLVTPEILQTDFSGMSVKQNEQKEVVLNEGPFHQGSASVVRFFAKK